MISVSSYTATLCLHLYEYPFQSTAVGQTLKPVVVNLANNIKESITKQNGVTMIQSVWPIRK